MSTYSEVLAVIDNNAGLSIQGIACDMASALIVEGLRKIKPDELTKDRYTELRDHYMSHVPDGISAEAARQRWSRLFGDSGHTVPASTTNKAMDCTNRRQQEKDRLAALSLEEVEKCMLTAKQDDDFASAAKYKRELDRRAAELLKPEIDARKNEAKTIKALVTDKLSLDQLKAIHAAIAKIIGGAK